MTADKHADVLGLMPKATETFTAAAVARIVHDLTSGPDAAGALLPDRILPDMAEAFGRYVRDNWDHPQVAERAGQLPDDWQNILQSRADATRAGAA